MNIFIRFDNASPAPGQAHTFELMVFYSLPAQTGRVALLGIARRTVIVEFEQKRGY